MKMDVYVGQTCLPKFEFWTSQLCV